MRVFAHLLLVPLPWRLRRILLIRLFGHDIDPRARIGRSLVAPQHLKMSAGAVIGHLNVIRGVSYIAMDVGAGISHLNWICGVADDAPHFPKQASRRSRLIIAPGGGITRRHFVDCTDTVTIGEHAMVAGMGSQILTHAVDLMDNEQAAKPVTIGAYSMVGTRCVILGGSALPDYSALGAGSTLRTAFEEAYSIYSGVPAVRAGSIDRDAKYFSTDVLGQPGHRLSRTEA